MSARRLLLMAVLLAAAILCQTAAAQIAPRKIVFIAGRPSHGPGEHEYRAGCLLLQKCLTAIPGLETQVYSNGWPADPRALDGADAIVLSMDGAAGYDLLRDDHLQQLGALMSKGAGLACLHWAVEPTPGASEKDLIDWLGGAFEPHWSINPIWTAHFTNLPVHPITSGVKPFQIRDEWYFHLRIPTNLIGFTPILSAVAPEETVLNRPDGAYSGNPAVRRAVKNKEPQVVAWAWERPDGGRGFGFTGGHYHRNYGDDNFRKVVLNGLLWIAHVPVPPDGVESRVTPADLEQNLDVKHK